MTSKINDWRSRVAHCGECGRAYETRAPEGVEFTAEGLNIDGEEIELSIAQDALVRALLRAHGRVVSATTLLWELSGDDELDLASLRIVEKTLSRLRQKLNGTRLSIRTRTGVGYYTIMAPAGAEAPKTEVIGDNSNDNLGGNGGGVFRESRAARGGSDGGNGVSGQSVSTPWEPLIRTAGGERAGDGSWPEPESDYVSRPFYTTARGHVSRDKAA